MRRSEGLFIYFLNGEISTCLLSLKESFRRKEKTEEGRRKIIFPESLVSQLEFVILIIIQYTIAR